MNNRTIKITIAAAVLVSVSAMGCNSSESGKNTSAQSDAHMQHTPQAQGQHPPASNPTPAPVTNSEPAQHIPEFKFYKLRSGFGFEKSDIPAGKNTVFILFDPSCSHCQVEASELAKNYDKLKNVNLLFVSMNDPALMDKFLPTYGAALEGKDNVEMLYDREQQFIRQFHIPSLFPANYVYGSDGKLKSYWNGEKDIQEVLKAFTQ